MRRYVGPTDVCIIHEDDLRATVTIAFAIGACVGAFVAVTVAMVVVRVI